MSLFANNKSNYTIIVGCGRVGAGLADALCDGGANVLIIDIDEEAFRKLSPSFGGLSLQGDAMDIFILNEADIQHATAVVAVTHNDNTNILVAQLAKEFFHVPHVIARLYDPQRELVYQEFGIDTICPAILSEKEIDRILNISEDTRKLNENADILDRRVQ